jgi:hypothetical protein
MDTVRIGPVCFDAMRCGTMVTSGAVLHAFVRSKRCSLPLASEVILWRRAALFIPMFERKYTAQGTRLARSGSGSSGVT